MLQSHVTHRVRQESERALLCDSRSKREAFFGGKGGRGDHIWPVLRRSRPAHKRLRDALARSPPAQELGPAEAARRFAGIAARRASTARPSRRSTFFVSWRKRACQRMAAPFVLLRLIVCEEQRELECLREADEVELGGGRKGPR
jgi:hypothetical protein